MHFKDSTGRLYFLSAADIENGRTFVEVDGEIVEGPNRSFAMLPVGCVEISDEEADAIEHPPESEERAIARLQAAVQSHLDAKAAALGYDDIKTAVGYADEPAVPKFEAEGKALRAWRSLVWAACYQLLGEVQAGSREIPTAEALIGLLPALELPA